MLRGIASTILLALAVALLMPAAALAQDASPTPAPVASPVLIDPLDPRAGDGASQVGAPLLALVVVLLLGVAAAALTYGYVRLVRRQ